ncbi:MAG: FtsK/SpoIIIE domain-containing protein, partial [Acidimicrobiales bacterium]
MELALRSYLPGGERRDLLVEIDENALVRDLRSGLCKYFGEFSCARLYLGGRPLDDDALLLSTGILQGDAVGMDVPSPERAVAATRGPVLKVTGGPDQGRTVPLPGRTCVIGRSRTVQVSLSDETLSREHAELVVGPHSVTVTDLGSSNGTWLGDRPVRSPTAVPYGTPVRLGDTELVVEAGQAMGQQAQVFEDPDEPAVRLFSRASRERVRIDQEERTLPTPPERPDPPRFPIAGILGSLMLGVIMFVVASQQTGGSSAIMYLVFAVGSPLMIGGNVVSDRMASTRKHQRGVREYRAARRAALAEADSRRRQVEAKARADAPGPDDLAAMAAVPTSRVWERAPDDDDFLTLRIGRCDTKLALGFAGHQDKALLEAATARGLPATVSLLQVGAVGLYGDASAARPLAHWLALQVAVLHSPVELRTVVVAPKDPGGWRWTAWLPHTRPSGGRSCLRLVAGDTVQGASRLDEVLTLVRSRRADEQANRDGFVWPAIVVFVDGLDAALTRLVQPIVQQGPAVRVFTVVSVEAANQLPPAVRCRIAVPDETAEIQLPDGTHITGVLVDPIDQALLTRTATALAPLRDVGAAGGGPGGIPRRVRMEELAPECRSAAAIARRWEAGSGASTVATIGIGPGGPVSVDLSGQNTNALVAGTIGSGKSELLQTLVSALAVANRPDRLSFVLVDFKGGTAFRDAKDFPHVVGMLANLDGLIVERAIRSLRAEARRRQECLHNAHVPDIDAYWTKTGNVPPLPRVMIVIDEFAELARDHKELLDEFVSIAALGRALGMHLVLATQSPQGIVSEKIRANVGVRICLRVAKPDESRDVIDVGDAAALDDQTPGRALVRTGSKLVECQSAWVGWPSAGAQVTKAEVKLRDLSFAALGAEVPEAESTWSADTDLHEIVRAVTEAAAAVGVSASWRPWQDELPTSLDRSDARLLEPARGFVLGLEDRPEMQSQVPFVWDPGTGALLLVGGNGSGRSTGLHTIAAAAVDLWPPDQLHLYVIDGSPKGALQHLAHVPHAGAVVAVHDQDRLRRLVNFLLAERDKRYGGSVPGKLLVLINHAERLIPEDAGRVDFDRLELLEGLVDMALTAAASGIALAVSTAPDGLRAEGAGWRSLPNRLILPLPSADDYYLVDDSVKAPTGKTPPGRAVVVERGTEVQLATSALPADLPPASDRPPVRIDPLPL